MNNIRKNFTITPNELINDNKITDRARFLFVYMRSKPDEWVFYNYYLSKALGYSLDTLRKYLTELVDSGWILKERQKRLSGKFTANTYVLNSEPKIALPYRKNTGTEIYRNGKNQTLSNKEFKNTEKKKRKNLIL